MLPSDVKLISADDHIIEHPRVWQDRLPERYKEAGPRVVEGDDGNHYWTYEGEMVPVRSGTIRFAEGFTPQAPTVGEGFNVRFDQIRPGCYDPHARLEDMDEEGVWAQLPFPTFPRFGGHRFLMGKDQELGLACLQAYNDYILDEWSAVDRERLLALAILPYWNPEWAVAEIERVAGRGTKAIAFSENPTVLGLPSIHTDYYDPMWAALSDAELPVCVHIGSSSKHFMTSDDQPTAGWLATLGINAMGACVDWVFAGVLDRFPKLRVILSEGGAGWVPYMLERCDKIYTHVGTSGAAQRLPSETFSAQMYACMITEPFALKSLDSLPVDNLLWESDYPHQDSFWPHSRKLLEEALLDVPEETARKIAEGNARKLFKL